MSDVNKSYKHLIRIISILLANNARFTLYNNTTNIRYQTSYINYNMFNMRSVHSTDILFKHKFKENYNNKFIMDY